MTACSFLLGAEKGILALIIGLIAAVIIMLIWRKAKHTEKGASFPLVPFLSLGAMVEILL
jgi:prepilin signal peptidase PulO-like enzyme (type II secretory pathway)